MRVFKWIVGIVSLLVIIVAGGGYLWLKLSLPGYEGRLAAPVKEEVTILRDELGLAAILAGSEADAFFALGFAQAQDRFFQMEMLRRAGSGRLAEILGPELIEVDKLFLALSATRTPEEIYQAFPQEIKEPMARFAAGINFFLGKGPLPLELRLLGVEPEPWQPADAVSINMVMAWDLNLAWSYELTAAAIADKLGPERVKDFLPAYEPAYPTIVPPGGYLSQTGQELLATGLRARELLGGGPAPGSNSWVLAGSRTETGAPILANDPHLGFSQPPIWWEGTVICPGLTFSGVFIPGVPVPLIGHTPHHAWGLTNVMADDADFFIERLNPDNQDQYLRPGGWKECRKVQRKIKVKGGEELLQVFRITDNGLIINDLKTPVALSDRVLAMRWVGQDHTAEVQAFYGILKARTWEEFKSAVGHFSCPGQNFVYADVEGNIGWIAGAKIPRRRGGYDPVLPAEAAGGTNGWDGYLDYPAQPSLLNPEQGFIVTANNKSVGPEYPHYISSYWAGPERAARIGELIRDKKKLSTAEVQGIQVDIFSKNAEALLPPLLEALTGQTLADQEGEALAALESWDLTMDPDSAGPAIFEAVQGRLFQETLTDELGQELLRAYLSNHFAAARAMRVWLERGSDLFDDRTTPDRVEKMEDILCRAFRLAVLDLEKLTGQESPAGWRWGALHTLTFEHPFKGRSRLLDKLLNLGPYPVGGSLFTVNPTQHRLSRPGDFSVSSGASMRQVIDLGDLEAAGRVITTGQSGHFMSPHYGDQVRLWLEGRLHPVSLNP